MRSSISSFSQNVPNIDFGKTWFMTVLLVVLSVLACNQYWKKDSIKGMVNDDAQLWANTRRKIPKDSKSSVVLIGASRIQVGIDQKVFFRETGIKPVQLAVAGESPIPTLRHLAEDESFSGTVISGFVASVVYNNEFVKNTPRVDQGIEAFKNAKAFDSLEFWLRSFAPTFVVAPRLGNNFPDQIYNFSIGVNPDNLLFGSHPAYLDRSLPMQYERLNKDQLEKMRNAPIKGMKQQLENAPPSPEAFIPIVDKIESYVNQIQTRGGKVVFVNMPFDGELWELHEKTFPRRLFWDVFASKTSARTIHFKDYPALAKFKCIDGSHLEAKDAQIFTKELVKIIFTKNWNAAL